MKAFSELYTAIDETTKTNAKINALAHYFSIADEKDAIWCVAMLTGRRPKRTIKSSELKLWCMEIAQIPEWLFLESYGVVGDLSETITLLLPPPTTQSSILLSETIQLLKSMEGVNDEEKKKFIQSNWQQLSTQNALFLIN
jgi:DNA ligase-1